MSEFILSSIDAVATFSIIIPSLAKELKVKTYTDLDPFRVRELNKVYKEQYYPWYSLHLLELLKEDEVTALDESEDDSDIDEDED